jgi:hypothetical protein
MAITYLNHEVVLHDMGNGVGISVKGEMVEGEQLNRLVEWMNNSTSFCQGKIDIRNVIAPEPAPRDSM